jgi:hypothetical protein
MRGKALVSLFVLAILIGALSCSKKQTDTSQTSQTPATQAPATQTSPTQQAGAAPALSAQPSAPPPQTEATATQPAASTPAPPAEERQAAAVPSGTALVVQLNDAVSSKTAQAGEAFTGKLAKPVIVHGETLIPRGAEVSGRVTEVKAAGKVAGAAQMALKLTSVSVGGKRYEVSSNVLAQTSKGKGKRTAVMGGGGAGLGAVVGGLAGGGKGALVGGVVGGGAGTAGSAFTGNADITLPAESVLSFHLTEPLDLSQSITLNSSK